MEYAVLETGGKQYKVAVGDVLEVERLTTPSGTDVVFDHVLLYVAGDAVQIGTPLIAGFTVNAKVVAHTQGDKIDVAHFRSKSRHRRSMGYRQSLTKIQISGFGTAKKALKK